MAEEYRIQIEPIRTNQVGTYSRQPRTVAETIEGDLILSADGDLLLPTDTEQDLQYVLYVIQTRLNSSILFRGIGTRIRSFLGYGLTEEILVLMEQYLMEDLLNNNIIPVPGSLEINPMDTRGERVLIVFGVDNGTSEGLYFEYIFEVDSGAIEQIGGSQT